MENPLDASAPAAAIMASAFNHHPAPRRRVAFQGGPNEAQLSCGYSPDCVGSPGSNSGCSTDIKFHTWHVEAKHGEVHLQSWAAATGGLVFSPAVRGGRRWQHRRDHDECGPTRIAIAWRDLGRKLRRQGVRSAHTGHSGDIARFTYRTQNRSNDIVQTHRSTYGAD